MEEGINVEGSVWIETRDGRVVTPRTRSEKWGLAIASCLSVCLSIHLIRFSSLVYDRGTADVNQVLYFEHESEHENKDKSVVLPYFGSQFVPIIEILFLLCLPENQTKLKIIPSRKLHVFRLRVMPM